MTDESFNKPEFKMDKVEENRDCEKHGTYLAEKMTLHFMKGRVVYSQCPACKAEIEAAEELKRQAEETERKKRHYEHFLGLSNIPHRFKERNFDNFQPETAKHEKALAVCRKYAEEFDQNFKLGKSLILSGKPGTGKSHLAAAVIQSLYPKRQGQYLTLMELIRLVRGTWHKNSEKSEAQVLKELIYIDLLVIDEIGVQYGTDGEQNIIFDVLDGRYREQMPTILLTNQDKEGLAKCIGERVFDRLRETATWVSFDWESYRPKAR